jgi:hypothetical protein
MLANSSANHHKSDVQAAIVATATAMIKAREAHYTTAVLQTMDRLILLLAEVDEQC